MKSPTKRDTPVWSMRARKVFADNYGPAFAGMYFGARNESLILARHEKDEYARASLVAGAKAAHRNYLRCLREARNDAMVPATQLMLRQAI